MRQAEERAQGYRDKLAGLAARIQAIAPDLRLPPRLRKANPVFARGEPRGLAPGMLREGGKPLAVRDMAVAAFRTKGVRFPDRRTTNRRTTKQTRVRLRGIFARLQDRGVGRTVGTGKATRRASI